MLDYEAWLAVNGFKPGEVTQCDRYSQSLSLADVQDDTSRDV